MQKLTVTVEGAQGAGKTTLIEAFKKITDTTVFDTCGKVKVEYIEKQRSNKNRNPLYDVVAFMFLAPVGIAVFCALLGVMMLAGKFLIYAVQF